jgi:hypothetical protein
MFRKNYLPKVDIKQDFSTKKWFAYQPNDSWERVFVQFESGEFGFTALETPTKFEKLDDLVEALYLYAMKEHLEQIKKNLTYNSVIIMT